MEHRAKHGDHQRSCDEFKCNHHQRAMCYWAVSKRLMRTSAFAISPIASNSVTAMTIGNIKSILNPLHELDARRCKDQQPEPVLYSGEPDALARHDLVARQSLMKSASG